jgi:hypothetical protein
LKVNKLGTIAATSNVAIVTLQIYEYAKSWHGGLNGILGAILIPYAAALIG